MTMYDSVLLLGFGGPTSPDEVRPFLDNVVRGKDIPKARYDLVIEQYRMIGGFSPFNALTFRQAEGLERHLKEAGFSLHVYVGMRHWSPYIKDTLREMTRIGHRRALAIILSPFRTEASWDVYLETVAEAQKAIGPTAPQVDCVPPWGLHPLYIEAMADRIRSILQPQSGVEGEAPTALLAEGATRAPQIETMVERIKEAGAGGYLIFTAHSIPLEMADRSPYISQFTEAARLITQRWLEKQKGHPPLTPPLQGGGLNFFSPSPGGRGAGGGGYSIAYQSRSGRPMDRWLEPDVRDEIKRLAKLGHKKILISPIGFVTDHAEILYDLDILAAKAAREVGVTMHRSQAANDHPMFIKMLAELVRSATPSPL